MRCFPLILVVLFAIAYAHSASALNLVSGRGRKPEVETHIDRGIIKFTEGDKAAARAHYDEAIRLDPKAWQAYYDRAVLSFYEKKWTLALADLNESMRLYPKYLHAAVLRSDTNAHMGNYEAALAELDTLSKIRLRQTAEDVYNNRAWIHATARNPAYRNGRLAVEDATRACNASYWKSPRSLDTLAAAYAETGDFDSAAKYERKAVENISALGGGPAYNDSFRKVFQQRLASFEQHKIPSYN